MSEEWRPVVGYEGLYEVSNLGRVRSCARVVFFINGKHKPYQSRIKALRINQGGYVLVTLSKNCKRRSFTVHKLVARAFLGPCEEGIEVNHKDEDKTNNRLDNLEYCTKKYNANYGTRGARISKAQEKPIESIDCLGRRKRYSSVLNAEKETHISHRNISRYARGERCPTNGLKWRYIAEIEHYGLQDCEKVEVTDDEQ